ncbi:Ribosomal protein [Plasmodium coatneyi]|uniref:Ribosomal protein n=1 Tax=Plasmodium coatneyi TaxID=208452 RepID=A0A1B1DYL3_9APIC|nr:Ribosomal protein [Plasmodium coatneyi]ANQ07709.1 Ribosomal protein [Plasmodium coatneyi]
MNPHNERIPHLGRSIPPGEPMDPPPKKKVGRKKMETQMNQTDTTKQRHTQIGDRVKGKKAIFDKKKKTKRKKLILLEKEAKQSVYNALWGESKTTLPQMEGSPKCGGVGYIKFISRKVKWRRGMVPTDHANCRWGQLKEEQHTKRDSPDRHHLEEAPNGTTNGAPQIGEEVARVKRFLLLWGGKFPKGGVLKSEPTESAGKGAVMAHPTVPTHDEGNLPNREQIKECILRSEKIINYIQTTRVEKKTYINEYVDQVITEELNNLVKSFLEKISKSQEKLYLMKKKKKRYYLGLRECYKHVCIDNPKLVLLAPNIEPMTNGVFDEQVSKIICKCREKGIPLVYALSKNLLGKCIKKSRQSVICIVDNDSFIRECNEIVWLANSLRRHAPISTHDTSVCTTLNAP